MGELLRFFYGVFRHCDEYVPLHAVMKVEVRTVRVWPPPWWMGARQATTGA